MRHDFSRDIQETGPCGRLEEEGLELRVRWDLGNTKPTPQGTEVCMFRAGQRNLSVLFEERDWNRHESVGTRTMKDTRKQGVGNETHSWEG